MTTAFDTQKRRSGAGTPGSVKIRLPLVLLALLATAILVLPELRRPTELHKPEGYTALVNALLRTGDLIAEDDGEHFKLSDKLDVQKFADGSFLRSDIGRFNGLVWGVEEIQPTAHYESGPRDDYSRWQGDLRFRSLEDVIDGIPDAGSRIELIDEESHFHIPLGRGSDQDGVKVPECSIELQGSATCPGLSDAQLFTDQGSGPRPLITRVQKVVFLRGEENFELLMVGDQPVLHLPSGSAAHLRSTIRIDGAGIAALGGASQLFIPLRAVAVPGTPTLDVSLDVQLAEGSRRFRIVEHRPLISRYRTDGTRAYPGEGLETFAKPIEAAMDGRGIAHVRTSLIEELQANAQGRLTDAALLLLKKQKLARSFRASATLMDGLSGEIAALATFPTRGDNCNAEKMSGCDTLAAGDRDDPDAMHLFDRNTNFMNLPIGSAAKPPFAVAITDRFPELLQMKVEDSTKAFGCVMGWDFGNRDIEGHNKPGMLDYPHFLAASSNRYAIALMLLGLKDTGGKSAPFLSPSEMLRPVCRDETPAVLNGNPLKLRPPFGKIPPGAQLGEWDDRRLRGNRSVAAAWRDRFSALFCVQVRHDLPLDPALCPHGLWPGGSDLAGVALPALDLPPPDLDMDEVRDLVSDYLIDVLGGGRSRWSTILLAQTYARIITGENVQATLAPRMKPRDNTSLNINTDVRRMTLQGMNLIFSDAAGGTARRFPALANDTTASDGSVIRFYAKTGTPNVVRYTSVLGSSRALEAFRARGCLHGESAGVGEGNWVYVGARGETAKAAAGLIAGFVKGARCAGFADQAGVLAEEIARINRDGELRRRVALRNGVVSSLPTRRADDRVGGEDTSPKGRVFGLVAARYPAGSSFSGPVPPKPCSVSVLAVNFQTRLSDQESSALSFAGKMLGQPEFRAWLGRRSGACGRVTIAEFLH